MAVAINIFYIGKDGNARRFAEDMESLGIAKKIRNVDGNLKYEYFYPKNDTETVLLIDIWENQRALDLHHSSPMMGEIIALREKYDLHMRVERYISDEGIPESDKKFIRE